MPANEGWQIYDLRNDSTIPDGSVVNWFYLDADGTGGTWGGFHKKVLAASKQDQYYEQFGGIDLINLPTDTDFPVKQQWGITGKINYSLNFVWEPNICIDYKFPVIIANMNFV